jgi:hypothetical protein
MAVDDGAKKVPRARFDGRRDGTITIRGDAARGGEHLYP